MTNRQAPQSTNTTFQKLKLDRQGGARFDAGCSQFLRIRQRALRFLHIYAGAKLQELDLSRCAPGLELTIDACPELRRIRLPVSGQGAVVHLNAQKPAQALEIIGPIQSLDASWQARDFAIEAGSAPAFNGARIGQLQRPERQEHDIVVEFGERVAEELSYTTDPRVRQLLVLDAPALRRLHLPETRALEGVQLINCASLEEISGARIHRLDMALCPALRRVGISGHAARLSAGTGATEGVVIEQPWIHLTITASPARALHVPVVDAVMLRDCASMREATICDQAVVSLSGRTKVVLSTISQLRMDEGAVGGLLLQAQAGDTKAQRMLEHWCGHARRPWEFLETLRALAAAPADPAYLWRLRCRLHIRCNQRQGHLPDDAACLRYAYSHWSWRLPSDRYLEGWEADLTLWLRAQHVFPELERMLRQSPPLIAVAVFARQLSRRLSLSRQQEDQLCRAIRRARKQLQQINNGVRDLDRLSFDLLLSAAASQRSLRMADAILARLQRSEEQAIKHLDVLASLAALGHARARVRLMQLAQSQDPQIRAKALALALAPVRNELFATQEEAYA